MAMSSYAGFPNGVTIQNLPILNTFSRNVYWVHSGTGSNGNKGTFQRPFASVDYAVGFCSANRGDIILVKAGHAETFSVTGPGIDADVAGIAIIGLGQGTDMPELTFTHTGADIDIDAANVTIKDLRLICGVDSQTHMVDVNSTDATVEGCEFVESSATGLTGIDINGGSANACDRATIRKNRFIMATAANWDRAIELGEVADHVLIDDNHIVGDFDDAGIHNVTGKVLTNLTIRNNYVRNNQAGQHAIELVSACTGTAYGNRLVTDAQATAFDAGALSAMDNKWNISTGGDSEGVDVNPITSSSSGTLASPRLAIKEIAAAGTSFTTGASPVTIFTVTGNVLARVFATVGGTAVTSTSNNGTLAVGVTGSTALFLAATTADTTNFPQNSIWIDASATLFGEVLAATPLNWALVNGTGSDIIVTIGTNSMTAGVMSFYCMWIPLSIGASVVAA